MLKNVDKLLTGDLLKVLCDMGHGDELVIADANFPAENCAQRLIRLPGIDGVRAAEAILSVFPLDTYSDPAILMDLIDGDKAKGVPEPEIWAKYHDAVVVEPKKIERFEFYERAKKSKTYLKRIDAIANYFNVSPGYLLRGIEDGPEEGTKGALEDEMIRVFRKMSPKRQELLIQVGRTLLSD